MYHIEQQARALEVVQREEARVLQMSNDKYNRNNKTRCDCEGVGVSALRLCSAEEVRVLQNG